MGIDIHGLHLLQFAAKRQRFGRVATMGRQGLHVPKDKLKRLMRLDGKEYGEYCEDFLKAHFGANSVESFDNSSFEGATHILDLNEPTDIRDRYDTIIDLGTMEHVFNAPQGLKTLSQMCAPGGQLLHMLPANNFCGHGFWQFSPELFFSLYSKDHGYSETQVFLADVGETDFWYEVAAPMSGKWDDLISGRALYVLVRTRKTGSISHDHVQQAQYVHDWANLPPPKNSSSAMGRIKGLIEGTPLFPVARFAKRIISNPDNTLRRNSNLKKRHLAELGI